MEIFAYILALIWSILCLILFFKIWGMTNNVEQLTQEVHELKLNLEQGRIQVKTPQRQEGIPLVQSPSDIPWDDDLKIEDKVKLKSNGKLYKVVGFEDNGYVQCEPEKMGIFDNFVSVKRSGLIKI